MDQQISFTEWLFRTTRGTTFLAICSAILAVAGKVIGGAGGLLTIAGVWMLPVAAVGYIYARAWEKSGLPLRPPANSPDDGSNGDSL